jgi:ubiquinone/menaquinone biosynthesis C-methylase UbiE
MSIAFDRAVEYYDQTRTMPPERHRVLIESLVREAGIAYDARVLEIGIGTGRIALSVVEHVRRLFGIDLSFEMMGVIRRKLIQAEANIYLAQADAVQLPFSENTFDAVYGVHVLHLIQGWQNALGEVRRVQRPNGRLVVSFHKREDNSPNIELRRQLHVLVQSKGIDTQRPGARSEEEIYAAIEKQFSSLRIVSVNEWTEGEVPEKILGELDRQIFSETWMIPRAVMDEVMPRLRAWAEEHFGDLTQPVEVSYETRWLVAQKE